MKGANKLKYFKNKDELLFYRTPAAFTKHSPLEVLKYAIGANLYMPGTQNNILRNSFIMIFVRSVRSHFVWKILFRKMK